MTYARFSSSFSYSSSTSSSSFVGDDDFVVDDNDDDVFLNVMSFDEDSSKRKKTVRKSARYAQDKTPMETCTNCNRTFYPDRLLVHMKSCKEKFSFSRQSPIKNNFYTQRQSSPMMNPMKKNSLVFPLNLDLIDSRNYDSAKKLNTDRSQKKKFSVIEQIHKINDLDRDLSKNLERIMK